MNSSILPALLWILHVEESDLKHIAEVTRLDIFDGATSDFHDDGLFSTRIFGLIGSAERDLLYGKIKLGVRILHPKIYREITSLRDLYKQIINGSTTAVFDEQLGDFVPSTSEEAGTGYSFFMRYAKKIRFRQTNSIARKQKIAFLEKWKHRWDLEYVVVGPAGPRDVEVDGSGRVTKHEINDFYYRLLAISRTITPSDDMESDVYDQARRSLTMAMYELYQYVEMIFGGKGGFMKDKWASRRVREGTRNVLTSMNTSGSHLDSPNVPGFDSTVLGLYQAATSVAPLVIHWLKTTYLEKILISGEGDVPLIDKKTLKTSYASLNPFERDRWTTDDGLRDVIHSLTDVEARNEPVEIAGRYLALVYNGEGTFRVFDDIDELPGELDSKDVHPMTLVELIYLCGYSKWKRYFTDIVRYPIAGEESTYPSRLYVKTTSVGEIRREMDSSWTPMEGDEYLAVEYPIFGLTTYHDSQSPHPSRLVGLGADFDGDTGSATTTMIEDSLTEIEKYLKTRNAWVNAAGRMRADVTYDTADLVVRNLTGRFNHVKQSSELITEKLHG